jgi:hypothetical protein
MVAPDIDVSEIPGQLLAKSEAQEFDERKRREFRDYLEGEWDKRRIAFLTMRSAMQWRRVTLAATGALLAVLGVTLFIEGYQDWLRYEAAVVLLGIIIGGIALFLRVRGRFPEQPELERELDSCVRSDRARLLEAAASMVAHVVDRSERTRLVLNGYPDRTQLGAEPRAGRIGSDRKVRITPFGLFVLYVGRETVITYECAVDILTGQPVYEQVRDFPFSSVTSITRTVSSKIPSARRIVGRREKDRDALSIAFADGSRFTVLLRDNTFVESWTGIDIPALVDEGELGGAWEALRKNWFATAHRSTASSA